MKGMGDMMQMVQMMQKGKEGVQNAMKKMGIAGILADIVNAQRMDAKRMGQSVGINIEINQMTEDRASEIIANAVKGNLTEFARVFDDIQKKRDAILNAQLSESEMEDYVTARNNSLPRIGNEDVDQQEDDE